MRVLLACGGTGGHINPALAIANAVKAEDSAAEILFIGAKIGMEGELVPKAGFSIRFIDIEGFRRGHLIQNARVAAKLGRSFLQSRKIIKEFRPDIVIGTGGYVTGPVVLAAHKLGIPTLIHEQNAFAGFTTRMLSGYVDCICVAFPQVRRLEEVAHKTVFTGNPIRGAFRTLNQKDAKRQLGVDDGLPFLICFGGSLGAQKINECMVEYIKHNHQQHPCHLLLVTGELYIEDVRKALQQAGIDPEKSRVHLKSYLHDMHRYLAAADVVICRSGALSLSEINYLGKASILIPSPNVTDNHQEFNADAVVSAGGAIKLKEQELSAQALSQALEKLLSNPAEITVMAENSRRIGIGDAAEKILKQIHLLLGR